MDYIKFKNRGLIAEFLDEIAKAASIIVKADSDKAEKTKIAQSTGPHMAYSLQKLIESILEETFSNKKKEWNNKDLASQICRTATSSAFTRNPIYIAAFEKLFNDVIERYENGDYSFSPSEVAMNKAADENRVKKCTCAACQAMENDEKEEF